MFRNDSGSLVSARCVNSRVVGALSAFTVAPLWSVSTTEFTVISKATTLSSGSSPIFTCTALLLGAAPSGVVELPPPHPTATISRAITPPNAVAIKLRLSNLILSDIHFLPGIHAQNGTAIGLQYETACTAVCRDLGRLLPYMYLQIRRRRTPGEHAANSARTTTCKAFMGAPPARLRRGATRTATPASKYAVARPDPAETG